MNGCFRSSSIEGLPCEFDADCLHFRCIQKVCGGPGEGSGAIDASDNRESPDQSSREGRADSQQESTAEKPKEALQDKTPEKPPVVEDGERTLHQPCSWWDEAPAKQRCAKGLLCVRSTVFDAFCLQDCSQDSLLCNNNKDRRTQCVLIGIGAEVDRPLRYACLDVVGKDFECDLTKSITCKSGPQAHLVCQSGKCVEGKLAKTPGEKCGPDQNPPAQCDLAKEYTCSASNGNTCQPGVAALEGDECGDDVYCQPGFQCIGQENGLQVCMKVCDINKPANESCPNRPNFTCLPTTSGGGVCAQSGCTSYHECAFKSPAHECAVIVGNRRICFPFHRGPQPLGAFCDATFKNKNLHCQSPLSCVRFQNDPPMTACVPQCRFDKDCKAFSEAMVCDPKVKSCTWPCQSNTDCPKGLTCADSKFCASTAL